MTSEELETLEEIARVLGTVSKSLAYLELAVRDLAAGKSPGDIRPALSLVRSDA